MNGLGWLLLMFLANPAPSEPEIGGGFDRAVEIALPRVVRLYGLKAGLSAGYGSGILVSDDGLVVTVFSLLLDSEQLRVVTSDGTPYGAEIISTDEDQQLALLRLTPMTRYDRRGRRVTNADVSPGQFPCFEPGDSSGLLPGDWVIAAANPFKVAEGNEPVTTSVGVFSTRTSLDARRKTRDFPCRGEVLVIDSITSTPGSPGGALVNLEGEWVGMIGRLVISNTTHTNFNYAIPVEVVSAFIERALNPTASRVVGDDAEDQSEPYHGIKLFEAGYRKKLVYVDGVKRGSPARTAGLRKDDLIVSVNGRNVADIPDFRRSMRALAPGDLVELAVIRNEKLKRISFELGERQP